MAIPKLTENPSKLAEVTYLKAVAADVPQGSYLASLLRPAVVEWFEQRMRDDCSCDLWAELEFERKDQAINLKAAHDKAADAVNAAKAEAHKAEAERGRLQAEVNRLNAYTVELLARTKDADEAFVVEMERAGAAEKTAAVVRGKLEDALIEVRDLKAKLFDLLVASGKVTL